MNTGNPITDTLQAPLGPNWTIDGLAEQILRAVANEHEHELFEFIDDATIDAQSRRLIRPLLACFATMASVENSTPVNLYGGQLTFKRTDIDGPFWITGQFHNRLGDIRISLRRLDSIPSEVKALSATKAQPKTATAILT